MLTYDGILIGANGYPYAAKVQEEIPPLWPTAFIEWLEPRLNKSLDVLEWGSGNGSLWLARRVNSLVSVEHHVQWNRALRPILAPNARLVYVPLSRLDYYPQIIDYFTRKFDIIIIDGMRRDDCIHRAIDHLAPGGLMVLDNSDSEAFASQVWLKQRGWKSITLRGKYQWTEDVPHDTRVFWRDVATEYPAPCRQ